MKTAMQDLLAILRAKKDATITTNAICRAYRGAYVDAILIAESLLADEKKQMQDCYFEAFTNGLSIKSVPFEHYYTETFN